MVHSFMSPHSAFEPTHQSPFHALPHPQQFQPLAHSRFWNISNTLIPNPLRTLPKNRGYTPIRPILGTHLVAKPLKRTPLHRGHDDKHPQYGVRRPRAAFDQPDQANKSATHARSHPTRRLHPFHSHSVHRRFTIHSQTPRDHTETARIDP
jgi:hypothetical protein